MIFLFIFFVFYLYIFGRHCCLERNENLELRLVFEENLLYSIKGNGIDRHHRIHVKEKIDIVKNIFEKFICIDVRNREYIYYLIR